MQLFKYTTAIGLELDTGSIRVAEIKKTSNNLPKIRWEHINVPETAIAAGVVNDARLVAKALQELWSRAKIKNKKVVLGVFNQGVLLRLINFPLVPQNQLAKALRFQAEDFFPIPLEQLVMDYAVLGKTTGQGSVELQILLVAIRKEILEHSLQALALAAIEPVIIDIAPLALMRLLPPDLADANVALIHVAYGWGWLLLIRHGLPCFARVLAKFPPLNFNNADVVSVPTLSNQSVHWVSTILEEVDTSLDYYCKQLNITNVDAVYVSGLGARDIVLNKSWQQKLGAPVFVVSGWQNMFQLTSATATDGDQVGGDFAICTGLALRGLETIKNAHKY